MQKTLRRILSLSCFLILSLTGYAEPQELSPKDVRRTMQEMFHYHVEFKDLTPLLVKRSFKIYIEQFDREKLYLLEGEVKPFLDPADAKLEGAIQAYYKDDFNEYILLNQKTVQSIQRARQWRQEIERELILSQSIEPARGESYLHYASSQEQLKARLKNQLVRYLQSEARETALDTPQKRERAFALWEKRLQRMEETYLIVDQEGRLLPDNRGSHYFTLHLLKALAKSLDAHTAYFSPEEAFEMRASLEKQFEGIGVLLKENLDGVVIADLIKGGPAERSGKVRKGDLVVAIDGKPLDGLGYEEVLKYMKGDGEKEITLTLQRANETAKVRLVREKIVMDDDRLKYSFEPFGEGIIGKLTLSSFYESGEDSSCELDIRQAIKELKQKGDLLGLVLDMRENSGGFLNQAVKVAGLFITSGVIVISKYAQGEVQYLRDIDGRVYFNGPLLILTSRASASAAEIVAQSLQDYGAALIVGDDRTYGKGTIQYQTVTDDDATAFYKVTVGRYYTVSGKSTQIEGVQADIVVPTEFSIYNIGERFLEYPLKNDRVPSVYVDPLSDLDQNSKRWFQKNYLPNLQKKESTWQKMLPSLSQNSAYRLKNNKNFQAFLQNLQASVQQEGPAYQWGAEDLQMEEAVNIVKDMILLQEEAQAKQPALQK